MKFGLKRENKEPAVIEDIHPDSKKQKEKVIQIEELVMNNTVLKDKILTKDDLWDYVRVVNVRGTPEYQPKEDEKVITANRDNPTLGNKHPALVHTIDERMRVIAACKVDLDKDLEEEGPISKVLFNIALEIVENKQKMALACWCTPLKCHCDLYVPVIVKMAQEVLEQKYLNNIEKTLPTYSKKRF